VFRVPAPDLEALIGRFLRDRCRDQQTDLRSLIEAQIARVTVEADSISVELADLTGNPGSPSSQTASLPWSKKPFRVAKGVLIEPTTSTVPPDFDSRARGAVLTAINRARRWVDMLMAGASVSEIATQEDKSPRHIRLLTSLAFISPRVMSEIIDSHRPYTATDLAGHVPLVW